MGYKETAHERILKIYNEEGANEALRIATGILHSQVKHDDIPFRTEVHGELCESVLEVLIREYMKKFPEKTKDWLIGKGWILKSRHGKDKPFMTEIDLTLLTAECVYVFECKSYSGKKRLVDDGTIVREDGKSGYDVYKQNKMHREVLEEWLEDFVLPGKLPVMQMCLFLFCNGTVVDERTRAQRIEMPCLTVQSLYGYLQSFTEPSWMIESLKDVAERLDEMAVRLRPQHLEYVKSLHH